ncbi:luciferase domain-containing protein [Williamsia phyllosphaerae]|uniref:Luciferase domain-containing protein n=1 Tax=Williamsia phyllosphaerae TaxID=885042 RepID=A0ABQ1V7P8_9NOCA|nr:hypothetical protein [Williamsia phyllosphaerae]GGF43026.1 hypothetical protein GCM10007298_43390 [Williamsia phyllosphaerae]
MTAVLEDYRRWRALGEGGLPANPVGWLVARMLRPWGRDTIAVDAPTDASPRDFTLPQRSGDRPTIAPYPIPHRELHDVTTPDRIRALAEHVAAFAAGDRSPMINATSRFERHGDALFVRDATTAAPWIAQSRGEVAHVHGTQGSLHVVADPADVSEIITRGWGERHPLAGRPIIGLPDSYLFLYAPRDESDLEQLERIIDRVVATAR